MISRVLKALDKDDLTVSEARTRLKSTGLTDITE